VQRRDPNAVQVVLPADHVIRPREAFQRTVRAAVQAALDEASLIVFGIHPSHAATAFGWIKSGGVIDVVDGIAVHVVERFVEKPTSRARAGIPRAGRLLLELGHVRGLDRAIARALETHYGERVPSLSQNARASQELARLYADLPSLSIDVAVLERARGVRMLPIDYFWSDVGSWDALATVHEPDGEHNVACGGAGLVALDSARTIVCGERGGLIALDRRRRPDRGAVGPSDAGLPPRPRAGREAARRAAAARAAGVPVTHRRRKAVLAIDHGTEAHRLRHRRRAAHRARAAGGLRGAGDSPELIDYVARLLAEREVEAFVVGWPFNMDGSAGPRAADGERVRTDNSPRVSPQIALVRYDERLTTKAAEELLARGRTPRQDARARRDSWSALVLLRDGWLAGEPRGRARGGDVEVKRMWLAIFARARSAAWLAVCVLA
jgi:putative transcription antitermination factor YqgF